jgi:hypothetical protein
MTTVDQTRTRTRTAPSSLFWKGAGLTAVATVLFPRINAVMYDHEKIWQLDKEAAVLAPLVVVVSLVVFAAIGVPLQRSRRAATASLVVGVLAVLGFVAYWISLPIMLGGLAVTLGIVSLEQSEPAHRGFARAGVVLGAVAALAGAVSWLINF